ncbi:hypothetical protein SDC9_178666 [bioreactor metagenome]|uniref:Uncharacterized protein n=1 Tax=bioreactor metagenome TaxID=1076179 RepID=A0A645GYR0_9ZZZZ
MSDRVTKNPAKCTSLENGKYIRRMLTKKKWLRKIQLCGTAAGQKVINPAM